MLDLSPKTEELARYIAETRRVSVDQAVRQALEAQRYGVSSGRKDMSPEAIAKRMAAIDHIVAKVAEMPVLDPRTTQEIVEDLNAI